MLDKLLENMFTDVLLRHATSSECRFTGMRKNYIYESIITYWNN